MMLGSAPKWAQLPWNTAPRFASGATTLIPLMDAPLMATTDLNGFMAACLSAPARGITAAGMVAAGTVTDVADTATDVAAMAAVAHGDVAETAAEMDTAAVTDMVAADADPTPAADSAAVVLARPEPFRVAAATDVVAAMRLGAAEATAGVAPVADPAVAGAPAASAAVVDMPVAEALAAADMPAAAVDMVVVDTGKPGQ